MAVTINPQPTTGSLNSPYRPLEITATSNDTAVDGTPTVYTVKMKCYITIDGTEDNTSTPIVLYPNIGTSYTFTFDISSYVRDFVSHTMQTKDAATTAIGTDTNSIASVKVRFKEVRLDTATGLLSDSSYSSYSNTFYCIDGLWQYDEVSTAFGNFELKSTGSPSFLTNKRSVAGSYWDFESNESNYVSGFTRITSTNYIRIRLFSGKNLSGSSVIKFLPITVSDNRLDFPCGVTNINAATTGTWQLDGGGAASAGNPVISNTVNDPDLGDTVGSYTFMITNLADSSDASYVGYSEALRINVNYDCSDKYTRIKFLNRLGAFEYFTFKGDRDRSISLRKNYTKQSLESGYSIGDGGDRVNYVDSRTEFVVYSQALKETERIHLEELLEGFECFVEEGSNYIPIKVRAGKTKIIEEGNDLITLKMTYQYANENRRQHG